MVAGMLQRGTCARGILTAALCTLDPATIGMLAAANMLAPDGRCKTLDSAADGCEVYIACMVALSCTLSALCGSVPEHGHMCGHDLLTNTRVRQPPLLLMHHAGM